MRPVERGEARKYTNGAPYKQAKPCLIENLGPYCSYCERRIPASLAVEHLRPKILNPGLETEWSNFLLACANCNSAKGTLDQVVLRIKNEDGTHTFYKEKEQDNESRIFCIWPDKENSSTAFRYLEDGSIEEAQTTPKTINEKKKYIRQATTLALLGLTRRTITSDTTSHILIGFTYNPSSQEPDNTNQPNTPKKKIKFFLDFDKSFEGAVADLKNRLEQINPKSAESKHLLSRNSNTINSQHDDDTASTSYETINLQRRETLEIATRYRRKFDRLLYDNLSETQRERIDSDIFAHSTKQLTTLTLLQASASGFWSIWNAVFREQRQDNKQQKNNKNNKRSTYTHRPAIYPVLKGLWTSHIPVKHQYRNKPHEFLYAFPGTRFESSGFDWKKLRTNWDEEALKWEFDEYDPADVPKEKDSKSPNESSDHADMDLNDKIIQKKQKNGDIENTASKGLQQDQSFTGSSALFGNRRYPNHIPTSDKKMIVEQIKLRADDNDFDGEEEEKELTPRNKK